MTDNCFSLNLDVCSNKEKNRFFIKNVSIIKQNRQYIFVIMNSYTNEFLYILFQKKRFLILMQIKNILQCSRPSIQRQRSYLFIEFDSISQGHFSYRSEVICLFLLTLFNNFQSTFFIQVLILRITFYFIECCIVFVK